MRKIVILVLLCALPLVACEPVSLARQRAERVAEAKGNVVIAVVWPSSKASLVNGICLAVEQINAGGGILGGRKLELVVKNDGSSLSKGRLVAQQIADNVQMAAVIGHLDSYIAGPAAQIYERAGLLMITPGAAAQKITEQGDRFVFRSLPGNRDQGRQIGDYAFAQKYKNVAIYYVKNDDGIDLANHFEQRARELGIAAVDRRSYDIGDDHATVLGNWAKYLKMDAIFLIGPSRESAEILHQMRSAGLRTPVFGSTGLNSPELIERGGADVEGTVAFSLFNADDRRPEALAFKKLYRKRFGMLPDSMAAQGYDTLDVVAQAMRAAQSAAPVDVAAALRSTSDWHGVTGDYTFSANGDPVAKRLFQVVVKDGKFVYFTSVPPASYRPAGLP